MSTNNFNVIIKLLFIMYQRKEVMDMKTIDEGTRKKSRERKKKLERKFNWLLGHLAICHKERKVTWLLG